MIWIEVDDCWNCEGEGIVYEIEDDEDSAHDCWYCQGTGEA